MRCVKRHKSLVFDGGEDQGHVSVVASAAVGWDGASVGYEFQFEALDVVGAGLSVHRGQYWVGELLHGVAKVLSSMLDTGGGAHGGAGGVSSLRQGVWWHWRRRTATLGCWGDLACVALLMLKVSYTS